MNSTKDVWNAVLEILSTKLTTTAIRTWFSDCEAVELEDGRLVLHTTPFKRDVIQQRFAPEIREALRELFSCDFDLLILAGDELTDYQEESQEKKSLPQMNGYTFDNFIVGACNKLAHAAALGVVKKPGNPAYNPLFIYGNSGLGKTHLLLAIGSAIHDNDPDAKIIYVKGEDFLNEIVHGLKEQLMEEIRAKYRYVDLLLVDDIQIIAGKDRTQAEFFHTFNTIYESGHQIVLTSDRPPLEMTLLDDRLRTRFEGGLMADVQAPDKETRMAIIRDKAGHMGMRLSDEIVLHIAEKITSNVRQLEGVVKKLTAYHDLGGTPVNKDTVDSVIADVIRTGIYIPTPDDIINETANYYQLDPEDIKGQRRSKNIAMARHVSMYLCRTLTNLSLTDIGKFYGNRDHATVLASNKKIENLMRTDPEITGVIRDITSNINSRQR